MTRRTRRPIHAAAVAAFGVLLPLAGAPAGAAPEGRRAAPAIPTAPPMQAAPGVASATEPSDKPAFGLPTSAARVEARIAYLHKTLGITSAQEPQFSAYAEVMRANAQAMRTLFQQRAHTNDATADGRLRWYAQLSAAYADAMQKQLAVFEPLYQSLSDAQKKAADAAFADLRIRPRHRHAG